MRKALSYAGRPHPGTVMWSLPGQAAAAEFDGSSLSVLWALPFVGILLSIALFPLLAAHAWEHHQGKIAALWGLLVLIPMAIFVGPATALQALVHTALLEYIPFILLLLALFTVAGGIWSRGNIHGAPSPIRRFLRSARCWRA